MNKLISKVLGVAVILAAVSPQIAQADTFTPKADPPVVSISSSALSIQPGPLGATYSVVANVASQGTMAHIAGVTLCLTDLPDVGTQNAITECASSTPDPIHAMVMTWTHATTAPDVAAAFAVVNANAANDIGVAWVPASGGTPASGQNPDKNTYVDAGSTALLTALTPVPLTALAADWTFTFNVSKAMFAGNAWRAIVVATDTEAQVSNSAELGSNTVAYYGEVSTQRSNSHNFMTLAKDRFASSGPIKDGAFIANANSDISMSATDFTYENDPLDVITLSTSTPGAGQAKLACGASNGITSASQTIHTDFATGTGEVANDTNTSDCTLTYGGGTATMHSGVPYSSTITTTIAAH
jgi:hypothetical protein